MIAELLKVVKPGPGPLPHEDDCEPSCSKSWSKSRGHKSHGKGKKDCKKH